MPKERHNIRLQHPEHGRDINDFEVTVEGGIVQPILIDGREWRFSHSVVNVDHAKNPLSPPRLVFTEPPQRH
jgi:hypothetical protein